LCCGCVAVRCVTMCCSCVAVVLQLCCSCVAVVLQLCNTLQHTATHCNTLQHNCNTLQHAATHGSTLPNIWMYFKYVLSRTALLILMSSWVRNCNTLQHPATLPYIFVHFTCGLSRNTLIIPMSSLVHICSSLQLIVAHGSTLPQILMYSTYVLIYFAYILMYFTYGFSWTTLLIPMSSPAHMQHTATHCNTLQHTAAHCNTHCSTQPYIWNYSTHGLSRTTSRIPTSLLVRDRGIGLIDLCVCVCSKCIWLSCTTLLFLMSSPVRDSSKHKTDERKKQGGKKE